MVGAVASMLPGAQVVMCLNSYADGLKKIYLDSQLDSARNKYQEMEVKS